MARPAAAERRLLGLWTAGWLAVLLLTGLLWVGDPSLQWPVLFVPLLWALAALRHRGGRRQGGSHRLPGRPVAASGERRHGTGGSRFGQESG